MTHQRPTLAGDLVGGGIVQLAAAAQHSGLFAALAEEPQSAEALAGRCQLHPRATRLVLDALAALGACARTERGYQRPRGVDSDWPWAHLTTFLATGEVLMHIDDERARRGEEYQHAVEGLAARFAKPAAALAAALGPVGSVLDIGCGSGVWSLAMASKTTQLCGLDLPEVVPHYLSRAKALGFEPAAVVGDYFETPAALTHKTFERVVLANVVHLETEAQAQALVARWAGSVAPGGAMVIIDCLSNQSAEDAAATAFYALHLGMRTAKGGVYEASTVERWCVSSGLRDGRLVRLPGWPGVGAFVARRG